MPIPILYRPVVLTPGVPLAPSLTVASESGGGSILTWVDVTNAVYYRMRVGGIYAAGVARARTPGEVTQAHVPQITHRRAQ